MILPDSFKVPLLLRTVFWKRISFFKVSLMTLGLCPVSSSLCLNRFTSLLVSQGPPCTRTALTKSDRFLATAASLRRFWSFIFKKFFSYFQSDYLFLLSMMVTEMVYSVFWPRTITLQLRLPLSQTANVDNNFMCQRLVCWFRCPCNFTQKMPPLQTCFNNAAETKSKSIFSWRKLVRSAPSICKSSVFLTRRLRTALSRF